MRGSEPPTAPEEARRKRTGCGGSGGRPNLPEAWHANKHITNATKASRLAVTKVGLILEMIIPRKESEEAVVVVLLLANAPCASLVS